MNMLTLSNNTLDDLLTLLAQQESFVFLETTKTTEENHHSFVFIKPLARLCFRAGGDLSRFFNEVQSHLDRGFYVAGWLSYELGYELEPRLHKCLRPGNQKPLAEFLVFERPYVFNHKKDAFEDGTPFNERIPSSPPSSAQTAYRVSGLRLNQAQSEYVETINTIKSHIAAGDTYQVNYTLKILFDFSGTPQSLYKTLRRNQSVSYGAFIKTETHTVLSFSPELFFKTQGGICTVRPMKGTIKRGPTNRSDSALAQYLQADPKNRSENVMIVDLLRNDLGRLCKIGSVSVRSLFEVETYETLHQMTSTVQGELRPDVSWEEIFKAIFPCGSVTGAPKIRTMEIIRALELEDRGVYTGAIGYISPAGDASFNVPIRTVVLNNGHGEMGVGSGIVYDSDPESEWDECRLKGKFLSDPLPEFQLIETLLWLPDTKYWLLDLHLERLDTSARYFGFPVDRDTIARKLKEGEKTFAKESPQRVRLTLDRRGEITITSCPCGYPGTRNYPDEAGHANDLPRICISDKTTDPESPFLYHKTTNRELYDQERKKAVERDYFEVIFTNNRGEITEGSITNVFVQKGGMLLTPPVECGLLPGIFRRYFLEKYADLAKEKIITRKDLAAADAVYVANSVRGLIRVIVQ